MGKNVLKSKSYAFALRIVKLYRYLCDEHREYVLSKQVLRSGTAVGALVAEAEFGQSRSDFVSKLSIALKEAKSQASKQQRKTVVNGEFFIFHYSFFIKIKTGVIHETNPFDYDRA